MKSNVEIAERLKGLREMEEISAEEMAAVSDVSLDDYLATERGERDFSFTLLHKCAKRLGVDFTEIVAGAAPNLSGCSLVKKGKGMPINRRKGFTYQHVAQYIKNRASEPFIVTAPFIEEQQNQPIALSSHKGQEMDYILEGSLKFEIDGKISVVEQGDTLYYDSSLPHGMIAVGGKQCVFMAIVMG